MKRLKVSTVINFFKRNGGTISDDSGYWITLPSQCQYISINLYRQEGLKDGEKDPSLEIHGARWKHRGNVHIDSYWGWPRSLKELQQIWDDIRETYGVLCGISWKDGLTIKWELERKKKEQRRLYNWEQQIKRWEKKC